MNALLIVISGPSAGRKLGLSKGHFVIGREPDCQCILDDLSVSRRHCVLTFDSSGVRIRDLNSRNGTFVNRLQIGAVDQVLANGDVIAVGHWSARIELKGGGSPESNPSDYAATSKFVLNDETHFDAHAPRPTEFEQR